MTASPRRSEGRRTAAVMPLAFAGLGASILLAAGAAAPDPPRPPTRPPAAARFLNVARAAGVVLRNVSGEIDKTTINEVVGNGVCLQDVDGDGLLDIFIPNGSRARAFPKGEEPRSALYRNRGNLSFEDVTAQAGVGSPGYWAQGCVFGDYDDDGRADLLVTGFGR